MLETVISVIFVLCFGFSCFLLLKILRVKTPSLAQPTENTLGPCRQLSRGQYFFFFCSRHRQIHYHDIIEAEAQVLGGFEYVGLIRDDHGGCDCLWMSRC